MSEPEATMSIGKLIVEASTVVQLVMLLLLAASVSSWAFIFRKHRELGSAVRGAVRFEQGFWSGGSLSEIYNKVKSQRDHAEGGMGRIFGAGFQEFSRMRQKASTAPDTVVEASQRAMRVAYFREMDNAERFLPFLATVGSTSPYIGLFGTVWGIMNSFIALGAEKQATLATVAPGIAEALIATALGLFAAIPAVIAYNRYASHVERLGNRYEIFMEEFISILHRHAHGAGGPES